MGYDCDNCDRPNGLRACQTDADCAVPLANGTTLTLRCIDVGQYGRCNDPGGHACRASNGNADCTAYQPPPPSQPLFCSQSSFGKCIEQLDDRNENDIGGQCDACDTVAGNTVTANSNQLAEIRQGVEARGDACDAAPVYAARPNISQQPFMSNEESVTSFRAAALVGRDIEGGNAAPLLLGTVGFRWCDCRNRQNNTDRPVADCFRDDVCTRDSEIGYNPGPGQTSTWVNVTTTATAVGAFPPPTSGTTGLRLSRAFSSVITDVRDTNLHPFPDVNEPQRVGIQDELYWFQATDIAAARVKTYIGIDGRTKSTGFFWSHAEQASVPDFASVTRDQIPNKRLRDHYGYVQTPLFKQTTFRPPPIGLGVCLTVVPPCAPSFRPDWLGQKVNPGPLDSGGTVILAPGLQGGYVAIGERLPPIDVTTAISATAGAAIGNRQISILTPVENGNRGRLLHTTLQGAALDKNWTSSSNIGLLAANGDRLDFIGGSGQPECSDCLGFELAPSASSERPGPRSGWRGVLSGIEFAVYMVGGRDSTGAPTGEIWRNGLRELTWGKLAGKGPGQDPLANPAPVDVVAIAYDEPSNKLLWIDHVDVPGLFGIPAKFARFVVFDTRTLQGKVALVLPRTGLFSRVSLAATSKHGRYVLLVQPKIGSQWSGFGFRLDAADRILWESVGSGPGFFFDDPISASDGLLLPILRDNKPELMEVQRRLITPNLIGCTMM